MLRKIGIVVVAYFTICLIFVAVSGQFSMATTALYDMTLRLVSDGGKVLNPGTASATTASYDHTCQVVDQNGTVLNPGTASATLATADCTARIIDSNGKVQSALGGGTASPTATPTPSFVAVNVPAVASGANYTVTEPSTTAGDTIYAVYQGTAVAAGAITPANWELLDANASANGEGFYFVHRVMPGESSSVVFAGSHALDIVCMAAYRGQANNVDVYTPVFGSGTSTTPTGAAITTTGTNDLVVLMTAIDIPNSGAFVSAATGWTDRVYQASVSGTNFGCDIEDKLQAVAGSTGSAHFTITGASNWLSLQSSTQP
jgi:hypothetical protein